ncbi:hypothetical protein GOP47_0029958 [Adiantum capillus-veneris]|nr:hypothetical protein GOP47_0029958 [Adiantum capillus-veneris]
MADKEATDMATGGGGGGAVEVIDTLRKDQLVLASRPDGMPDDSNFKVFEYEFTYTRPLQDENAVALKVLLISIDPYLREIMTEDNCLSGILPFQIGKPVEALSISKVMSSSIPEFKEGDYVLALTPVTNYVLVRLHPNAFIKKIQPKGDIPLAHYLGVLARYESSCLHSVLI